MSKLEKFYDSLILKGYEEITIDGYKQTINKFFKDIQTQKPKAKQAEQYLIAMRKKNYSYSHIKNTITNIKSYMAFIGQPIKIEHPRKPQTLPSKDILTEGEIARILAETKNNREKAMLSILAYCGLRNKELCSLKIKDIDLENNLIKVIGGKFKKDRLVPMSKECFKVILNYIQDYPRDNGQLFTTLVKGNNYNGWSLRKLVKVVARRAKIKKRTYPHLYRHSFITHLLERGANVIAVQNLAGHSKIDTTMRYTHFSNKKIQQEYQYYIPSYL